MNNQENSVLVQPTAETKSKKNNLPLMLVFVLLILSLGALGYLYYKFDKISRQNVELKSLAIQLAVEKAEQKAAAKNKSSPEWKKYTNIIEKYSIEYPSDWTLDTSKAEIENNDPIGAELSIFKGNYKITIMWPSAYGPGICIFDDQYRSNAPEMANYCEGSFKDIIQNSKRRLVKPEVFDNHTQWEVYTKNNNYFVTVPPTRYSAPVQYDENIIGTMDQILSTFSNTQ